MNLSKLWEMVEDRGAWHIAVHGVAKSPHYIATEQLLTGKIKNSTKNKQRPSERKKQTSTMPEKIILHRSGKFTFGQHPHSRLLLLLPSRLSRIQLCATPFQAGITLQRLGRTLAGGCMKLDRQYSSTCESVSAHHPASLPQAGKVWTKQRGRSRTPGKETLFLLAVIRVESPWKNLRPLLSQGHILTVQHL